MLKQILSVSDLKQLRLGDQLLDQSEPARAKTYIVKNIFGDNLFVIHEDGCQELKILQTNRLPDTPWWVRSI